MNKSDIINELSKVLNTKKEAQAAIDRFVEIVREALSRGDYVQLVGFGTFKVVERKARVGRNPRTGESLNIEARKVPKFSPGKGLKDAVN